MTTWMMAHPYLFSGLIAFALFTLWMVVANVCDVVKMRMIRESAEKVMRQKQGNEQKER